MIQKTAAGMLFMKRQRRFFCRGIEHKKTGSLVSDCLFVPMDHDI